MWCLTTWLGHPGNHGISNTPAITTIWFVSHPKVKSFPDENKFLYTSILYCWCVGNSVISQVAQPGGEAPHLEDKKIMFGNNQLLQVDFIRPRPPHVSHPRVKSFPDEYKFMYTSILYQHCCNNVCGGWGSYEINLKELTIPKHYLLSVVPHHLVGPPGKSRNFQHTSNNHNMVCFPSQG